MMMTMMKNYIIRSTLLHFSAEISCILSRLTPIHDILDEEFLPEFFQHFSSSYWAFSVTVHIIGRSALLYISLGVQRYCTYHWAFSVIVHITGRSALLYISLGVQRYCTYHWAFSVTVHIIGRSALLYISLGVQRYCTYHWAFSVIVHMIGRSALLYISLGVQRYCTYHWAFSVIVHIIFHLINRQRSFDPQDHIKRSKASRLQLSITTVHIRRTVLQV